jgi:pimeloyl-ACP methyl ester carboxylesterase
LNILRVSLFVTLFLAIGLPVDRVRADDAPAKPAASVASTDKSMISRDEVRRILDSNRMIITPQGIDEKIKLHINGIDQWISVRGKDRRNPILLFLHGGPASPAMPEGYTFQTPWEDYFTVVQWDQRGSGKTYRANTEAAMAPGMNVDG